MNEKYINNRRRRKWRWLNLHSLRIHTHHLPSKTRTTTRIAISISWVAYMAFPDSPSSNYDYLLLNGAEKKVYSSDWHRTVHDVDENWTTQRLSTSSKCSVGAFWHKTVLNGEPMALESDTNDDENKEIKLRRKMGKVKMGKRKAHMLSCRTPVSSFPFSIFVDYKLSWTHPFELGTMHGIHLCWNKLYMFDVRTH